MKKGIQILVVVLLIINLAAVGLLFVQLNTTSTRVDELYYVLEYELGNIEETIKVNVSDALLMSDYKVVNMSHVIDGYDSEKHKMTGTVSFEIINDEDINALYVVLKNKSTKESKLCEVQRVGQLKYTAKIEVGYDSDYEYYIISEGIDKSVNMRSRTNTIETSPLIHERAHVYVQEASWSESSFDCEGILLINEDIAKAEKIEVVVSGFHEDGHIMGVERHGDVLGTVDITGTLSSAEELNYDVDIWSEVDYDKYAFKMASPLEDGVYDKYKSLLISVTIYFEDETSLTIYQ